MAERIYRPRLKERDLSGSRLRCLMLTQLPKELFVREMSKLVGSYATINPEDHWAPRGFAEPDEVRIEEWREGPGHKIREDLLSWWLKVRRGNPNTPNWDIACTCEIAGKKGLILVEAKAHASELKRDDESKAKDENKEQIKAAIGQATEGLNNVYEGWGQGAWQLNSDPHYQLSNRFAWSWKLASLGVPVVLVWLGFLNAVEMGDYFAAHADWEERLRDYAKDVVPENVWGKTLEINAGAAQKSAIPLIPLIRSLRYRW